MRENERQVPATQPALADPGAGGPDAAGSIRDQAEALLRAADAAIARGLSRDSDRFVDSVHQSGGQ